MKRISTKKRLEIYNMLRQAHARMRIGMYGHQGVYEDLSEWEKNALDAVSSVLYLAESVFSKEEEK